MYGWNKTSWWLNSETTCIINTNGLLSICRCQCYKYKSPQDEFDCLAHWFPLVYTSNNVCCFLKFQIAVLDLIYRGKVISVEGESLTVQLTSTVRSVGCFSVLGTLTHSK